jgi:hypothetical protein
LKPRKSMTILFSFLASSFICSPVSPTVFPMRRYGLPGMPRRSFPIHSR